MRCLKNERLCINGRERFRLPWKTEGGARPGKQREETALHPDPETGRERGKRVRGEENQNDPLPLTAA